MYLSRFEINVQRRGSRKLLQSPQVMHAAVLSSFPGTVTLETNPRVLWRTDTDVKNPFLYVVSEAPPDFTALSEQCGWPTLDHWGVREYQPFLDSLSTGQTWRFRLVANPTRSMREQGLKRGKVVAQKSVHHQREWLRSRQSQLGLRLSSTLDTTNDEVEALDSFDVTKRQVMKFKRGSQTVTIARAQFDGECEVTDPNKLRDVMTSGIGRARGYGCGLLTLAPVK